MEKSILQSVHDIESVLQNYPLGMKVDMVAKETGISREEAKKALIKFQHSTEL